MSTTPASSVPPPSAKKTPMKLAVLTSGGDSAGMNAVVRAVVKTAIIKCGSAGSPVCSQI